jgi:hypothetical protein
MYLAISTIRAFPLCERSASTTQSCRSRFVLISIVAFAHQDALETSIECRALDYHSTESGSGTTLVKAHRSPPRTTGC